VALNKLQTPFKALAQQIIACYAISAAPPLAFIATIEKGVHNGGAKRVGTVSAKDVHGSRKNPPKLQTFRFQVLTANRSKSKAVPAALPYRPDDGLQVRSSKAHRQGLSNRGRGVALRLRAVDRNM
jgi:hypothetical protein